MESVARSARSGERPFTASLSVLSADQRASHAVIRVTSEGTTEFIDITDRIDALVTAAGIRIGLVNIQTLHTTTAIVVNEHEPLLLGDFETTLQHFAPRDARYRHDETILRTVNLTPDERVNGHAHCQSLVLNASVCLNVVGGKVLLGRWQRVFFVELDGSRERSVSVMVTGEAHRSPNKPRRHHQRRAARLRADGPR